MASKNQITANRRNANKSTGPRTKRGKAVAKLNSLRHGLLAEQPVLPDEDGAAFEALRRELTEQFEPVGIIETQLVERIAGQMWRLQRVGRIEAGVIEFQRLSIDQEQYRRDVKRHPLPSEKEGLTLLQERVKEFVAQNRLPKSANSKKQRYQEQHIDAQPVYEPHWTEDHTNAVAKRLNDPLPKIGHSFIRDAQSVDALGKLQRYERSMERSYYTAIRELERLQRNRREKEIVTIEGEAVLSDKPSIIDMEEAKPTVQ